MKRDNILVEVKDVSYEYKNGTKAIDNVNLKIESGKFVTIIGKNGSGKSTIRQVNCRFS